MLDDDFPAVIIMLKEDINEGNEITINYNWKRKKTTYLSVCKCSSDQCKLFVEQDAAQDIWITF
jgi:hypothetical protein